MTRWRCHGAERARGTHAVQAALDGLREKNLIWRSARGAHAREDENLAHWFNHAKAIAPEFSAGARGLKV